MHNGRECLDVNPVWHFSYILGRWFIHWAPLLYTELFFLYLQPKYFNCLLCKVTSHTIASTQETGVSWVKGWCRGLGKHFLNSGEVTIYTLTCTREQNFSSYTRKPFLIVAVLKVWKKPCGFFLCFTPCPQNIFCWSFFLAESFPGISNISFPQENPCSAWGLSVRCCSRPFHTNQTDGV